MSKKKPVPIEALLRVLTDIESARPRFAQLVWSVVVSQSWKGVAPFTMAAGILTDYSVWTSTGYKGLVADLFLDEGMDIINYKVGEKVSYETGDRFVRALESLR